MEYRACKLQTRFCEICYVKTAEKCQKYEWLCIRSILLQKLHGKVVVWSNLIGFLSLVTTLNILERKVISANVQAFMRDKLQDKGVRLSVPAPCTISNAIKLCTLFITANILQYSKIVITYTNSLRGCYRALWTHCWQYS